MSLDNVEIYWDDKRNIQKGIIHSNSGHLLDGKVLEALLYQLLYLQIRCNINVGCGELGTRN